MLETGLLASAALLVGCWLVYVASKLVWPGWLVVAALAVLDTDASPVPILRLGSLAVYLADALSMILVGVSLIHLKTVRSNLRATALWLGPPILLVGFNVAVGVALFGATAVVEARPTIYVAAVLAWSLSLDWYSEPVRRVFRRWTVVLGVALLIVLSLGLLSKGFNSASDYYVDGTGAIRTLRPVVAAQACALGLVGIFSVRTYLVEKSNAWLILASLCLLGATVAQHRTVWVALVAGMAALLADRSQRSRLTLVSAVALVGASFYLATFGRSAIEQVLSNSLSSGLSGGGTFGARTEGWGELISQSIERGPASVLLGQPFGSGFARISFSGELITWMPHNWYVSLYLRMGLIGVSAIVLGLVSLLAKIYRQDRFTEFACLIFLATYCVAYSLPAYVAPFLIASALGIGKPDRRVLRADGSPLTQVRGVRIGRRQF